MKKLSWRAKLLGLITATLGAVLLLQLLYIVPHIRQHELEMATTHQEEVTRNIARELDTDLKQTCGRLLEFSKRPEFRRMDLAAMQQTIETVATGSYRFESLSVMDAKGWFVCTSFREPLTHKNKSYADRPFFSVPFEQGKIYFGAPRFFAAQRLFSVSTAVPIVSEQGQRVGVLIGGMRLNHLIETIANYPLEEGQTACVVDRKGTVVAHSGKDLFALKDGPLSLNYSRWPMTQAVIKGQTGDSQEYEHADRNYLGSHTILESNGWGVVVGTSMGAIRARSDALVRWLLGANLLLFACALFFSLAFARQITAEEKRAEARIEHLNALLRAIRNVNQLITQEKHRDRLLKGPCDNLIETRGYYNAWIALLDDSGSLTASAESGLGERFAPMVERLERGELTACGRRALAEGGVVVVADPPSECGDCPLAGQYADRAGATVRLAHAGAVYGLLSVSLPREFAGDEEGEGLIEEVAGDIAAALHNMKLAEARERAEEALRESEGKLAAIVQSIPDHMSIMDKDLNIIWANETAKAVFGDDIIGKKCYQAYHGRQQPCEPHPCLTLRAFQDGKVHEQDTEVTGKDGQVLRFHCTANVSIRDEHGNPTGVMEISRNVTEQRQLEEQLRQSQKLEAVGQLAGGVAHDFNNVLTGISGYAELLADELEPGSRQVADLSEIRRLAARAADLTRQLLTFSRRRHIEPVVLNLNSVTDSTVKLLRRVISEDIDLQLDLASDLGNARADVGQIQQVLMNLVVNARDAMPTGGKLTIETANVELDQEYADAHAAVTPGPHVMLAVTDTGCGMDRETQERLFEPFFTTKKPGKGTGLGLATVYGIVNQHGGNIWVYSEPGKGTTFKVYLPRVEEEAEAISREDTSAAPAAGTETILVVEDEEAVRNLTRRILEERGYTVHTAADAAEGERLLQQVGDQIDLLLTDVVLPGISGHELYERHADDCPQMKVLYMSGYTANAVIHHGVLDKGIHVLQKPFTPEGLARRVRRVLDE